MGAETSPRPAPAAAKVVAMPMPAVDPNTAEALIVLAQRRAAWMRANPGATADEQINAGAQIAKELGL